MVTVLIVDDSAFDRKLAGGLLTKNSEWQVKYAEDGAKALAMLDEVHPDLILTDLQMPEVNGLELVQTVKAEHPNLPVVLMTGQGSETIAVKALQEGAASYVPKSSLSTILHETITRVLSIAGEWARKKTIMERMESFQSRFVMGNDPNLLMALVAHLQTILTDMNVLSESDRLRCGVALEEALLNASYHGNLEVSSKLRETDHAQYYELARQRTEQEPYGNRVINIDVKIDSDGLRYVVKDEGPGFDPAGLPDPTDPANLERPCGRGVLLMRTFMDKVEYNPQGNEVTMVKHTVPETATK
ncbi:MAG: ATP-binding protein [Planctomycetaceae bacterium]|nr:ATP-binding protein [Planctomycetaceae bacterium]MCA9043941.1 ATP-binding protein [Planctomycetaceae bacterium]